MGKIDINNIILIKNLKKTGLQFFINFYLQRDLAVDFIACKKKALT